MMIFESFCALCSDNLSSYIEFASLAHLTEIGKINLPISSDSKICLNCYEFLLKIQRFIEHSNKVQDFLAFVSSNFTNPDEPTINTARNSFGLTVRFDQQTSTEDIDQPEINLQEMNLAEIQEDNFVIEGNVIVEGEGDQIEDDEVLEENVKEEKVENQFEEFDYICHICNEEFKTFLALHSHTRKNHDILPEVYCPCGTTLSSRAQIQYHKRIHTSTKFYACKDCEKVYSHQQSLHNHIKKFHDSLKPFGCSKCHKKFDSERKLKIHNQTHLPDDKKLIHPCPIEDCDKMFSKSVNVQAHIKAIHMKNKPFLCSHCGKNFTTKGALKEHQIIHSDQFPYVCQFCDKRFKNLPRLKTHEDTHGVTQYICNVCGIALNTKRTLKMHMVVHSDQKKFKCEFCGSSFKRSKALKNHLILHSGLRPYACPFCDKTFANGSNCRSHKKKSHPQELAAFEAAGKSKPTPNIPTLDQLMPKGQQEPLLVVDSSGIIFQEISSTDIKTELPSIVMETTENFIVSKEK